MIFDCFKQDLLWQKISHHALSATIHSGIPVSGILVCFTVVPVQDCERYVYRYQFGIVLLFASKSNMVFTAADILFHIFTSTLSIILVPVVVLRRILVYRRR